MPFSSQSAFHLLCDGLPSDPSDCFVSRFFLEEKLRVPFVCEVEFSTRDPDFTGDDLLNSSAALRILDSSGHQRFVHGQISEIEMVRVVGFRVHFRLTLRPTLWSLSQRVDCRIFQELTSVQIIQQLLDEAGLSPQVVWETSGTCPKREFVVQYRESTLNFIQRLLEDEGIFYFFRHSEEGHEIVFKDQLEAMNDDDPVMLGLAPDPVTGKASPLIGLSRRKKIRVSEVTVRDFNVDNPEVHPVGTAPIENPTPAVAFEYGAALGGPESAQHYATARLKTQRTDADGVRGLANLCGLWPATKIEVDGVEETQLTGQYFVTEICCAGVQHAAETDSGEMELSTNYTCQTRFSAVPMDAIYCPPLRARRPKIAGVQTALVVGDSEGDQSIDVDHLGRIKVHFHWDRLQPADKNASCRIRVSQLPLGGSMILPRVGWEVLVAFKEGNPDRPIVLGRTYNAENMPPMSLPDNKASASLSSMSSPGGAGKNEISLGDSGGNQGFSIKAQKDLNATTGYDQSESIAVDDEQQVNANMSQSIAVDQMVTIGGNQSETFGANYNLKVAGNQTRTVGANETANATANLLEKVAASRSVKIGGNYMGLDNGQRTTVASDVSRKVGAVELVCTASSMSDNLAGNLTSTVGAVRAHLVGGSHSEAVAGTKNETIAGGAIHKTAGDLSIESEGASAQLVGAVVKRKVSGDLTIKAPMVTLVGGKGKFEGGGSVMDLAGGPIKLKGSSVVIKAALTKITAGSLKLG